MPAILLAIANGSVIAKPAVTRPICLRTVSYTHLDVYKRQVDNVAITDIDKVPTKLAMKFDTSKFEPFKFNLDKVKLREDHTLKFQLDTSSKYEIDGASAVSYTHLFGIYLAPFFRFFVNGGGVC